MIDEFAKEMFDSFLEDKEHAVCSLEVDEYSKKKVILLRLTE